MRSSSAHVFVDDLDAPAPAADDRHHLARVLRLRPGETVSASDGAGRWRACAWTDTGALEPTGDVEHVPRPVPLITIGFAVLKGDRPEWVVQKLTELGADRIVPFTSARTVARWGGDRATRHVERLRRVAREAAMQSRRVWLPEVADMVDFAAAAASLPGAALAEPGGGPPSLDRPTVLVGPEGGWAAEELARGLLTVDLGPTVLRAETAAVAVGAVLVALRSGHVAEP